MDKYRTIKQTISEIKEADPKSGLTEDFLRRQCQNGKIIHIRSGCKYLINLNRLEESLASLESEEQIT